MSVSAKQSPSFTWRWRHGGRRAQGHDGLALGGILLPARSPAVRLTPGVWSALGVCWAGIWHLEPNVGAPESGPESPGRHRPDPEAVKLTCVRLATLWRSWMLVDKNRAGMRAGLGRPMQVRRAFRCNGSRRDRLRRTQEEGVVLRPAKRSLFLAPRRKGNSGSCRPTLYCSGPWFAQCGTSQGFPK